MEKISEEKQKKPLIKSEKGINEQEVLKKIYDFLEKEKRDSVFEFIIDGLTIVNNNYKEYFENKSKCPKIVEKNGIHYIVVDGYELNLINKNKEIVAPILNSENTSAPPPAPFPLNQYLGKEYVVTDKSQIIPLFSFTMKRVEYCIIWRDTNFLEDKKYFDHCKKYKNILKNLNLYIETTTESALKLVWKKKYNKIILITNVGRNLEGKTYIDKVRKILGFNVVAFFFASSSRHLEWIKNYPNCLYANNEKFVNKFIELFNNEEGNKEENLNNLKKEIEKNFNTKLQDFYEPMKYPLYKDEMSAIDHYRILD